MNIINNAIRCWKKHLKKVYNIEIKERTLLIIAYDLYYKKQLRKRNLSLIKEVNGKVILDGVTIACYLDVSESVPNINGWVALC